VLGTLLKAFLDMKPAFYLALLHPFPHLVYGRWIPVQVVEDDEPLNGGTLGDQIQVPLQTLGLATVV